jgi:hypothetical protein
LAWLACTARSLNKGIRGITAKNFGITQLERLVITIVSKQCLGMKQIKEQIDGDKTDKK